MLLAFQFPPFGSSSGVHRILATANHLAELGWDPIVIAASTNSYRVLDSLQTQRVDPRVKVIRTYCKDLGRVKYLSQYLPGFLALPDSWNTWLFTAIPKLLALIRQQTPVLLWSSYPIATTNLIAIIVQRMTGIPWVADLRDIMTDEYYPEPGLKRKLFKWIERQTAERARLLIFTTPGAREEYAHRYGYINNSKFRVIENGFDEGAFQCLQVRRNDFSGLPIRIVHSGILYPSERDPTELFAAVKQLVEENLIQEGELEILFRGTGHDKLWEGVLTEESLLGFIKLGKQLPYQQALEEIVTAEGLLLMQADNCDSQIPGKVYEYLRSERPILALVGLHGDTANLLRDVPQVVLGDIHDAMDIKQKLVGFLSEIRSGVVKATGDWRQYDRRIGVRKLAEYLEQIIPG